jgi:hypothetical protein
MLGKLIKYEWKGTYKICGLMLLAIAGVTLVGALGFVLPFNLVVKDSEAFEDSIAGVFWIMLMAMSMVLYIIMLIGVSYGMLIYHGVRFYKTMYSDEGYLTQTLPVSDNQLIVSKTLVAGLWYLFAGLGIAVSAGILVAAMMVSMNEGGTLWKDMGEMMVEIRFSLDAQTRLSMIHVCVSLILMLLITPFSAMLVLFGSITIGQLSRKYKALMGILAYFGAMFVNMILTYILQFVFTFGTLLTTSVAGVSAGSTNVAGTYDSALLVSLIMGAAMYFISHYILTRKLNMD